jgi:uncharacterized membrane protein
MKIASKSVVVVLVFLCVQSLAAQEGQAKDVPAVKNEAISFQADVVPVIKKNCMPCHAEDNYNPSELSLDSYNLLMDGGKHGKAVIPGNAGESLLVQKLGAEPPFGRRMPLDPKRKKDEPSTKKLTDEEIQLISDWITQGAKNN